MTMRLQTPVADQKDVQSVLTEVSQGFAFEHFFVRRGGGSAQEERA